MPLAHRRSVGVNMKLPDIAKNAAVLDMIRRALKEDIGVGDITTLALVPESASARAVILSHGEYVISGIDVAQAVFSEMDSRLKWEYAVRDGERVEVGQTVSMIEGNARGILTAERTALNFLQRMTGIATLTSQFVAKVSRYGVTILDTRKTTPNMRILEKYAVLCGGGENHRMGLYDRILIKDNHRRLLIANCRLPNGERREGSKRGSYLDEAVLEARKKFPGVQVEVEVENTADLKCALRASPDWILLDNMSTEQLKHCVELCGGRSRLEASGGITLENVKTVVETGIDAISLGCLTHSAPAADLSLEFK